MPSLFPSSVTKWKYDGAETDLGAFNKLYDVQYIQKGKQLFIIMVYVLFSFDEGSIEFPMELEIWG